MRAQCDDQERQTKDHKYDADDEGGRVPKWWLVESSACASDHPGHREDDAQTQVIGPRQSSHPISRRPMSGPRSASLSHRQCSKLPIPPHHAEAVPTTTKTTAIRGSIARWRTRERRRSKRLLSGTALLWYPCSRREASPGANDATHRHHARQVLACCPGDAGGGGVDRGARVRGGGSDDRGD